ncbi:NB-ARC domain-containing protein [Streptomyces sp. NRRL S-481]|uniref:NB-ARC domain-containing protein n=1 Tax=Streptomyces sp. NRRL S-481 TaxID=1463911 RepID=UPI00131CF8F3|nr:NB-ARC domain-containing protein [Streptomyces sp. NRRL S-481]
MRIRFVAAAFITVGVALSAALALVAQNIVEPGPQWPGPLDSLRQHPWSWASVLTALSAILAVAVVRMAGRGAELLGDPPPPPPASVPDWLVDRAQTRATAAAVCRSPGRVACLTVVLLGTGGSGKTMVALAASAHRAVRSRFRSRVYTVTIGRDLRGRAALAAKVSEVTRFITGDTLDFADPVLAGAHLGRVLDQRPRTLLILDDVWEAEQLAPFLLGGRNCVRLVTTRVPELCPPDAVRIQVDQMTPDQARTVLLWGLPPLPEDLVDGLLRATGCWALMLRLTNRLIARQTAAGAEPGACADQILRQLEDEGPTAVDQPRTGRDLDDPLARSQAVAASVEASTGLLPAGGSDRFAELGIFAEDEPVPVPVVAALWRESSGLPEDRSRALCVDLARLGLVSLDPLRGGSISVNGPIREHLRNVLRPDGLMKANGHLVDAAAASLPADPAAAVDTPDPGRAWWRLRDDYLIDHLVYHLLAAGRVSDAEAVAGDLRWVGIRLAQRGPTAPWNDLIRINTAHTRPLARSVARAVRLLDPTDPPRALISFLHTHPDAHPHWQAQDTSP